MISRRGLLLVSALLVACSDDKSSSTPPPADASTVDVLATATDQGCLETSFDQTRDDPPTDACVAGATCSFSVNSGVAGCDGGGASSYPLGPIHWVCACETDARWDCNIDPSTVDAGTAACP